MEIHVYKAAGGGYVAEDEHAEALTHYCGVQRDAQGRAGFPEDAWPGYAAQLAARGVELVEQALMIEADGAQVSGDHQLRIA